MAILSRSLMRPGQRLDLEDWEVEQSSARTDSKFWHLRMMSDKAYIVKGFVIPESFIGQTVAEVVLDSSTLINANHSDDFSWYTAELNAPNIVIPSGAGGLLPGRNFVELTLSEEENTPLQRAFWDPSANSGAGTEFTNEVNTVTDLACGVVVNQSGFNNMDPTKIPLAIIDVDGSFNIKGIQDQRNMFWRLGTPSDPKHNYTWGSNTEPTIRLIFTVAAGTPFIAGEEVTFASGATATVVVGGTNNVEVNFPSNSNYEPGDLVTGGTSGATATLQSYYGKFVGADKDIKNLKDMLDALMTEIKLLKGTNTWFEQGPSISLPSLLNYLNTMVTGISTGARFKWDGSALFITDNLTTGQATSDVLAAIRTPGLSSSVYISRQDGTGGSASIAIPDQNVLWVELPPSGINRTYSEAGSGPTNFRVTPTGSFSPTDSNFVLAYRDGTKLFVKGLGELEAGEEIEITDQISKEILAFIGAASEADSHPDYPIVPDPSLSHQFSGSTSLRDAVAVNAGNINDIVTALLTVYYEPLFVTSAAPVNDNEVQGPITSGTILTLPLNSRDSDNAFEYQVGNGGLFVFRNGQMLDLGASYLEVGAFGTYSSQIEILQDLDIGERIEFRVVNAQAFGTAGLNQPFFRNELIGQNGDTVQTGATYNTSTNKLMVWRNGLAMIRTANPLVDAISRYIELNNSEIELAQDANNSEIFSFINRDDIPPPAVSTITGFVGTVLTVPTYTIGNNSLLVYRNGVLLTTNPSADASLTYSETSTTSITLDMAAAIDDVFYIMIVGSLPDFRESLTGVTGLILTIPNSETYTIGDKRLLVFRNGILMLNSTIIGISAEQYSETSTTQITLEEAAVISDVFEFLYI